MPPAGFDNIEPYVGYDSNVLNMYFNRYLPLAVSIGRPTASASLLAAICAQASTAAAVLAVFPPAPATQARQLYSNGTVLLLLLPQLGCHGF